jgi:Family of unknown function (DUF6368)
MGGPSASILLPVEPGEDERLAPDRLLEGLVSLPGDPSDDHMVWVETTKPIGGTYKGEGRPLYLDWFIGEAYPGEDEDTPGWRDQVETHFGFQPCSTLSLSMGRNDIEDHRILGELALYLARTLNGVIDFEGPFMIFPRFESREAAHEWFSFYWQSDWSNFSDQTDQWMHKMPCHVLGIPYQTVNGRTWISHICDVDFMAAWLKHPNFYMTK